MAIELNVLSSSRKCILSSYPDLDTKYTYERDGTVNFDFQFFQSAPMFVALDKKTGVELMHVKETAENARELSRVKKFRGDNYLCAAGPKQEYPCIAIGQSNAVIRLVNFKSSNIEATFKPDNKAHKESILYLDFNASDEYLSAVDESGVVALYGIKTKTKIEIIPFDKNCTLAKFHPTKRVCLTVASHNGSVFFWDINSKRKTYESIGCHQSPCKDLAMCPNEVSLLVSAGYDSFINIYDLRRKTRTSRIKCEHPLSTVALSDCGRYLCVGNLKGELISFDMRNTNEYTISKKCHDSFVSRVAFVPKLSSGQKTISLPPPEEKQRVSDKSFMCYENKRDSFNDLIELHCNKLKTDNRNAFRHDSFEWNLLNRRYSDFNVTDPRNSKGRKSSSDGKPPKTARDVQENLLEKKDENNFEENTTEISEPSKKYLGGLNFIEEETEEDFKKSVTCPHSSRKNENGKVNTKELISSSPEENLPSAFRKGLLNCWDEFSSNRNSTPKSKTSSDGSIKSASSSLLDNPIVSQNEIEPNLQQADYITQLNRWNKSVQAINQYSKERSFCKEQIDLIEDIRTDVNHVLHSVHFFSEFHILKKENKILKRKLVELSKKQKFEAL